jgi:hypothetical protein
MESLEGEDVCSTTSSPHSKTEGQRMHTKQIKENWKSPQVPESTYSVLFLKPSINPKNNGNQK